MCKKLQGEWLTVGNKVNAIEAIRARIVAAQAAGKPLVGLIKSVKVGPIEEVRKNTDFPIVNISLESGSEQYIYMPNAKVDNMDLKITLVDNKLDPLTGNVLYKTSGSKGILFIFEKLLNVIDNDAAGAVDLDIGEKLNDKVDYNYQIDYYQGLIEISTNLLYPTKEFTAGAR